MAIDKEALCTTACRKFIKYKPSTTFNFQKSEFQNGGYNANLQFVAFLTMKITDF